MTYTPSKDPELIRQRKLSWRNLLFSTAGLIVTPIISAWLTFFFTSRQAAIIESGEPLPSTPTQELLAYQNMLFITIAIAGTICFACLVVGFTSIVQLVSQRR
jgi:ABC-type spermidine/putrescine transport system permease subunit I